MSHREIYACQHCGAEAEITLDGFEKVEEVIRRTKKGICKACGKEVEIEPLSDRLFVCQNCRAEADLTLEGFESVQEVLMREKGLRCKVCGKEIFWSHREDMKAVKVAIEAEREAYQNYSRAAKRTKDPRGKDMFQQLAEFEMNHYQKLKALLKSLEEQGEWLLYDGTSLKKRKIPLKPEKIKGQEQLTDMDALKIAIREERKARAYYQFLSELTKDPRGKDMYKRLANEEELHEKILNDQYYSLHNTGIWSWGD